MSLFSNLASADNEQLKDKINDVQGKRQQLEQSTNVKKNEIAELEKQEELINAEIQRLDLIVAETAERIRQKEADIAATKEEINKLSLQIEDLQARIEKRDEMLKTRVRAVQETGGTISYLDVLLGAKSFGDFLDRVNAVSIIVQQDKEFLQSYINDKQMLEEIKIEVQNKLAQLEQKRQDLEKEQQSLLEKKEEKEKVVKSLQKTEEELEAELLDIQEQDEILAKQEASYKKLYQQWLEEQRRREEAKKRGETPPVTDGTFMRPAEGVITSGYGSRWGTLHAGIDIAKKGSNTPIVAAADGVVFRSYYSSSYGNVVFLSHNINGKMYTTVYAHMQSREVSEGETVKKGQLIGYMGNTGRSFGTHLHFEIHEGPWNMAKSNSVDPKKYIDF